ncbi:universal stress protein [Amycolatopsis sp. K13G38]|uniref:Universal stress protein n=1 Tax=Amycolatopsis acididurans TaxID=2724524 RepID=A0ABX1IWC0_9PSEU|nr:universal stress protein [Amycolatopsis acididurans]NKQ51786.1 universal stress protein [Amycolatopsis acididurans]
MSETTDAIVVGVDGSGTAAEAVRWAAAMAGSRNLRLHLLFGLNPALSTYGGGLPTLGTLIDELDKYAQDELAAAVRIAREVDPSLTVSTSRPNIAPVQALLEVSKTARTIVLGSLGRGGFRGMMAGSTAVAVAAHAQCPVIVVRPRRDAPVPAESPVVAGVDGSELSERALGLAFEEASWRNVPLVAVHSWSDAEYVTALPMSFALLQQEPAAQEQSRVLAESLAGWQDKYPDVRVERVVARDRPRHQLLEWSAKAQLVVVGSRGRGGFTGLLLGSTSQALIHHAECPVMIVRPEREA